LRYLNFEKDGVYDDQMLPAADLTLTLRGVARPVSVKLLGDGTALKYDYADNSVTIYLPTGKRTKLVDVVEVSLKH
jgi:hypothetical protein